MYWTTFDGFNNKESLKTIITFLRIYSIVLTFFASNFFQLDKNSLSSDWICTKAKGKWNLWIAFPDTIWMKIRAKYNFIADKIEIHKGSNIIRFYYTTFWMFWFHILIHFNLSIVHYFFQHSSHSIYRNTYGRSPAWHHCSKALKYWSFVTNYQSKLSTFTFGGLLLFPHNFLFLPPCRLGHVIWNTVVPLIVSHL